MVDVNVWIEFIQDSSNEEEVLSVIRDIQKDAYNQALKDAAENSVVEVVDHDELIVENIETYNGTTVILPVYGVDEDSILKLKK